MKRKYGTDVVTGVLQRVARRARKKRTRASWGVVDAGINVALRGGAKLHNALGGAMPYPLSIGALRLTFRTLTSLQRVRQPGDLEDTLIPQANSFRKARF